MAALLKQITAGDKRFGRSAKNGHRGAGNTELKIFFLCALCASVAKIPAGGGKRGLIIIYGQHNLEIVKRDWLQNQSLTQMFGGTRV